MSEVNVVAFRLFDNGLKKNVYCIFHGHFFDATWLRQCVPNQTLAQSFLWSSHISPFINWANLIALEMIVPLSVLKWTLPNKASDWFIPVIAVMGGWKRPCKEYRNADLKLGEIQQRPKWWLKQDIIDKRQSRERWLRLIISLEWWCSGTAGRLDFVFLR